MDKRHDKWIQMDKTNSLIAEFMDFDYREGFGWIDTEGLIDRGTSFRTMKLAFHYDWCWLMPVIEKISKHAETKTMWGTVVTISTTQIQIICGDFVYSDSKPQDDWEPFDIKRVHKAVVEFIKWYNNEYIQV